MNAADFVRRRKSAPDLFTAVDDGLGEGLLLNSLNLVLLPNDPLKTAGGTAPVHDDVRLVNGSGSADMELGSC